MVNAKPIDVNYEKCRSLASLIKRHTIPEDREDTQLHGLTSSEIGNFYFFLVAICHQTSPRGMKPLEGVIANVYLRGWDYLLTRFEQQVLADKHLLNPKCWIHMSGQDVSDLFCDPTIGRRLSEPQLRATLIRDLGAVMNGKSWLWADDMFELCHGHIATGEPNLLATLAQFRAYRDPARKKSSFFLALMRNSGVWQYSDPEHLGPPVDYHEVRGHLRIGTVTVRDKQLYQKLLNGAVVTSDEDISIRSAVYDAIMLLSELTGLNNPSQLHYLFWNVFRSCCTRDSPHCRQCPSTCTLPERYVPLAKHADGHRACPFSTVCASADSDHKLLEHMFDTDYY